MDCQVNSEVAGKHISNIHECKFLLTGGRLDACDQPQECQQCTYSCGTVCYFL